ncbi:MAG: TIGR03016 family PEP-CTERM system-associated outer membrane protein [Motiliproteus sp.]
MATTRIAKLCTTVSLLSLSLVPVMSYAEETKDWKFSPTLMLGLDYTNNLDLSATDKTESFISRVAPGVNIRRDGRYLKTSVNYQLQLVDYSASDRSDTYFHNLNAFADAELVEDHLFLDTRATASQQLIDNRDAGTSDPSLAADNFTNTFTFAITPTWKQRIGDYTNAGVSATYNTVIYQTGAESSEGAGYNLFLDTKNNPNKIYWTFDLRQGGSQSSDTGNSLNKEDVVEAQLGFRYSEQLNLRAGGGYVDNHLDTPTDAAASAGSFWSAGLTWTPSTRNSFDLYYSDRLQTNTSQGATFNHRGKRSSISLSYQQSLTDVRQQLLEPSYTGFLVCPGGDSSSPLCQSISAGSGQQFNPNDVVALEGFQLLPSLDEGQFINDSVNADYRYNYSKTSLTFGVFGNRRKFQDQTNREEQDLGFRAGWGWQISERSEFSANYNWSVLEPDVNETVKERDYRQGVNLGINRKLSPDASVDLVARYNKRRSDDPSRQFEEYGAGFRFNLAF